MERRFNPLPQILEHEPEASHGDFLDGLMATINYLSSPADNSHEHINTSVVDEFPKSRVMFETQLDNTVK